MTDIMPRKTTRRRGDPLDDDRRMRPYDKKDEESVLQHASLLSGKRLRDFVTTGEIVEGGVNTKGIFGQVVEEHYFLLENNSSPLPDFKDIGIELKVTPMKVKGDGYVSKERLVLGIINYDEVPERGFRIFEDKDSRILILFYLWEENKDIYDYEFLKVVDWRPSPEEMRMIRDDWTVIEGYIMRGEAHLLSERHTKVLAACTKGAGHGRDLRTQPFSSELAKQRALSLKASFMTTLFNTSIDIGGFSMGGGDADSISLFHGDWAEEETFEEHVLAYYDPFVGMTCSEIEESLGVELNGGSKQYYYTLSLAMAGVSGKKHAKELEQADITVKTVRIRTNGKPKESMSFPYIRFDEMVEQTWEESDLHGQLDHEFFSPVFSFTDEDTSRQGRKDLVFEGAFFWSMSDNDFIIAEQVWEETKAKVLAWDFDHFVKASDDRIVHIRPHARDSDDMATYCGRKVKKVSFWLNDSYIRKVVDENLGRRRRGTPRASVGHLRGPS